MLADDLCQVALLDKLDFVNKIVSTAGTPVMRSGAVRHTQCALTIVIASPTRASSSCWLRLPHSKVVSAIERW